MLYADVLMTLTAFGRWRVGLNLEDRFGKFEGICLGCLISFPFRNLTIDHIIPSSRGGTDHLDNLQLLCGACNSVKRNGSKRSFWLG